MTEEQIKKVEDYLKSLIVDEVAEIQEIMTMRNPLKNTRAAEFVTIMKIQDRKMGLIGTQNFSTKQVYRKLVQEEKYGKFHPKIEPLKEETNKPEGE